MELGQLADIGDAGRVEHDRSPAIPLAAFRPHINPGSLEQRADNGREPAARRTADQRRSLEQRLPWPVPAKDCGAGQSQPARRDPARSRGRELLVPVAHPAVRMATSPWPPAAQIEISPRPEPFSASSLASVATIRPPVAANG